MILRQTLPQSRSFSDEVNVVAGLRAGEGRFESRPVTKPQGPAETLNEETMNFKGIVEGWIGRQTLLSQALQQFRVLADKVSGRRDKRRLRVRWTTEVFNQFLHHRLFRRGEGGDHFGELSFYHVFIIF